MRTNKTNDTSGRTPVHKRLHQWPGFYGWLLGMALEDEMVGVTGIEPVTPTMST